MPGCELREIYEANVAAGSADTPGTCGELLDISKAKTSVAPGGRRARHVAASC